MRFPSIPTFIRTLYAFSNTTLRATPQLSRTLYQAPQRATIHRSMQNIPILGALFGSSSKMGADNTSYPVQKTEGEWQAVLSPGARQRPLSCCVYMH